MIIRRMALDKHGLELFCGPLEAIILSILWDATTALSPAQIHRIYIRDYGVNAAYSTIDATVHRMRDKGMLTAMITYGRKYTSVWANEDEFINACISAVLATIWQEYPAYLDRSVIQ